MNQYFYECAQDSDLGKKISDFWEKCNRCEREAEKYAKAMGAKTYYEDPQYFAGGCLCVAFADDVRIDPAVWREAGKEQDSGTVYYMPDVESRVGYAEIPHREYALNDTFDRIYKRDRIIQKDDKLFVPYLEFYRDEPAVDALGRPRTASRGLRKAIKAEIRRRRLPVMRTEDLLAILGADVMTAQTDGQKRREVLTPTFFPHRSRYFIGCAYPCTSPDLTEITPQLYTMNQQKHEYEMNNNPS